MTVFVASEINLTITELKVVEEKDDHYIVENPEGYNKQRCLPKVSKFHVVYKNWNDAHRYLTGVVQGELERVRSELKRLIDQQTKLEDLIDINNIQRLPQVA